MTPPSPTPEHSDPTASHHQNVAISTPDQPETEPDAPPTDKSPTAAFKKFCLTGHPLDEPDFEERTRPWYLVLWLTGVDYFSTLGYQPGIALLAAGALAEPATVILVLVTLLGAVPVYFKVAGLSYAGQGSIALLENLFSGWKSKIFVLVLLGFAATDFVITMTLSAADAAQHFIENPFFHPWFHAHAAGHAHVSLTIALLALLAVVFLAGFREAIGLAAAVAIPYIVLNVYVLSVCIQRILKQPELLQHWSFQMHATGDWTAIFIASAFVFPKLALGLSGFETGVSVMPLVSGGKEKTPSQSSEGSSENSARESVRQEQAQPPRPEGRIRATRKLLFTAALLMSALLLMSGFVTALLIPPSAYRAGGPADGRAIAYLAHQYFGGTFGTIYDFSTVLVLWFAGASAMAGLLNLVPRYLPRFGMAPHWVAYRRPLVLLLFGINVAITFIFHANVEAQGSAYATGVLVLILSAAVAVSLHISREKHKTFLDRLSAAYFWIVTAVFTYTLIANVIERPAGVIIAGIFILLLMITSAISRYHRRTEMRVSDITLLDAESERLWNSIIGKKINLVPTHSSDPGYQQHLIDKIDDNFKIEGPVAILHVNLLDNRSEFLSNLRICVDQKNQNGNYLIEVWGAVAIANSIAYISERLDPKTVVLGLTRRNLMQQSLAYALWGEGEIGLTVYSILVRYWETQKRQRIRRLDHPRILLMSG